MILGRRVAMAGRETRDHKSGIGGTVTGLSLPSRPFHAMLSPEVSHSPWVDTLPSSDFGRIDNSRADAGGRGLMHTG
jgi:hypothetical protein